MPVHFCGNIMTSGEECRMAESTGYCFACYPGDVVSLLMGEEGEEEEFCFNCHDEEAEDCNVEGSLCGHQKCPDCRHSTMQSCQLLRCHCEVCTCD